MARKCGFCGKELNRNAKYKKVFCNSKCQHKYQKENAKLKVVKVCPVCKKTFNMYPSAPRVRCSKECFLIYKEVEKKYIEYRGIK